MISEEKRRIVVSILTQKHGGYTFPDLAGILSYRFHAMHTISILFLNSFNFQCVVAEFYDHTGRTIALSQRVAERELRRMQDVVRIGALYLTTSSKSKHVCRSDKITPN